RLRPRSRAAVDATASAAFHAIVDGLEYPMIVVTAADGDERSGCLVGFHSQASIDPPLLADSPNWVVGRILDRVDGGDHRWHLLAPVAAAHGVDRPQLGYRAVRDLDPGHPA